MAKNILYKLKIWIDVRKRFHISHAYIQMAHEFGLNPKKFKKFVNHKQEPMEITSKISRSIGLISLNQLNRLRMIASKNTKNNKHIKLKCKGSKNRLRIGMKFHFSSTLWEII